MTDEIELLKAEMSRLRLQVRDANRVGNIAVAAVIALYVLVIVGAV